MLDRENGDAGDHRHLSAFLEMMSAEKGAAANTLDAYRRDLQDLLGFLAAHKRALTQATQADLEGFQAHLTDQGMATASRARKLSSMRRFFKFLHRRRSHRRRSRPSG